MPPAAIPAPPTDWRTRVLRKRLERNGELRGAELDPGAALEDETLPLPTSRRTSPRVQKAYHVRAPPHRASIARESKGSVAARRCRLSILSLPRPAGGICPLGGHSVTVTRPIREIEFPPADVYGRPTTSLSPVSSTK